MLTNAAVKAARPRERAYKIFDGQGLFLHVLPTGARSFRMKFRYEGKEQLLTLGGWPEITLDEARLRRDAARAELDAGRRPAPIGEALTFERMARTWVEHHGRRWTAVHAADVLASLERDVFPVLGDEPIGAIDPPMVLRALRQVEARGRLETARRLRQRISAIFCFAMSEGRANADPAAIVGRALTPPGPAQHLAAVLDIESARDVLAAAELVDAPIAAKLASRFLALTATRWAAVRGARWDEMDLDGDAPSWRVPAARMKLTAAKKGLSNFDHHVPLSAAAVDVLRAARAQLLQPDAGGLVFPGRGGSSPLGEGAIGDLYERAGFAGRHVPHGWRATFSTVMNELFPEERADIDRALAHAPKDKVEAAYNRSEQLARRRSIFERWGALLVPPAAGDTPVVNRHASCSSPLA